MGPTRLRSQVGFTIIEVLIASTVLLVGVVSALSLIDRANSTSMTTRAREAANSLARELTESVRGVSYDRITDGSVITALSSQPGLADTAGGGYTLVRRGVTYTVTADTCVLDDTRDGGGDQTGLDICPGSAASGTADRNPEDYKQVVITVAWERDGRRSAVRQTAIINNPGAAGGPGIQSITPGSTVPVTSDLPSLQFTIVTTSPAATVNWMLDGTVQAPVPTGASTSWEASWSLAGVLDGTYSVGAEAFDKHGMSGPTRQLTVQLNRFEPKPPTGVSAGYTRFGHVEIEWAGNSEGDIVGYSVTREDGVVVCSLPTLGLKTECRDPSPLDPATAGDVDYFVRAYDTGPTGARASAPTQGTAIAGNVPPGVPTDLVATNAAGTITLTWNKPSPEDAGPSGDAVHYYRIYRDGQTYSHRYARWFDSAGTVSWTDPDADGTSHTYRVTAVDTHYMESAFSAPVTIG